jgi:hypothetical protein
MTAIEVKREKGEAGKEKKQKVLIIPPFLLLSFSLFTSHLMTCWNSKMWRGFQIPGWRGFRPGG